MSNKGNGQYAPCLVCAQEVRKLHGPVGAEGPLCSKPCAQSYFVARQIATVRDAVLGSAKPKLVLPS